MSIQDQTFSLLGKIIRVISLKNVIIWVLTAIVLVVGVTLLENRHTIYKRMTDGGDVIQTGSVLRVSETSQNHAKAVVENTEVVSAVVVWNADIRNNKRTPVFWFSSDMSLMKQLDAFYTARPHFPLFGNDLANNENVISIINGDFACTPYARGNASSFPGLAVRTPWVCRASLPPYYGQFSGYVTLSLSREPTADEVTALKGDTNGIATEIYFRDIQRKVR